MGSGESGVGEYGIIDVDFIIPMQPETILKRDRKTSIVLIYWRLVEAVLARNQNQQQTISVQNPPQASDYQIE